MWVFGILCIAFVILWHSNKRRGQRFVRAVHFLDMLEGGARADEANGRVARLFTMHSTPDADAAAIAHASFAANRLSQGRQLPWINKARQRGFTIDSGNSRFDMAHLSQPVPFKKPDQEFSKHFSEGLSKQATRVEFPHTPPLLHEASQAGLGSIEAYARKIEPAIKAFVRTAIRWAARGAVAGFVVGLLTPRTALFGHLEVWAVPVLMAFFGVFGGLAIGAVYRVLHWTFND